VRTLEARFHPEGRAAEFIVVGKVLCHENHAIVEPSTIGGRLTLRTSLATNLRYLAAMNAQRSFDALRALKNPFWSFVEVDHPRQDEPRPQLHRSGSEIIK
jgi:hypothetical protein